jgi:parallel beta-helix repeat protein
MLEELIIVGGKMIGKRSTVLFLFLASVAIADCIIPYDGLVLNESATLCQGTYDFSNVTYRGGPSGGVITINASNVVLDCNGSTLIGRYDYVTMIIVQTMDAEKKENITIENCNIDNSSVSMYVRDYNSGWATCPTTFCLKKFEGTFRNIVIRNNNISNGLDGITVGDTDNARIENNNFRNFTQAPLRLFNSNKGMIRCNTFTGSETAVGLYFKSDSVLVVGNSMNTTLSAVTGSLTKTVIIGNVIQGPSWGIELMNFECLGKAKDILIFNNIIRDASIGIVLTEFPEQSVTANFFDNVETEVMSNRGGQYWGCSYSD